MRLPLRRPAPVLRSLCRASSTMATTTTKTTSRPPHFQFGPFDVSTQVFYATPLSFALVNLKPLLPGHVLVCPRRVVARVAALRPDELADLMLAVQRVEGVLGGYFGGADAADADVSRAAPPTAFNLAIQDGPDAGQTVPHVHVHVLPRIPGASAKDPATDGDALYDALASEPGNVGGHLWDAQNGTDKNPRPLPGGRFPPIEDSQRTPRSMADMEAEAAELRGVLRRMGMEDGL